jgi:hypothetical protein
VSVEAASARVNLLFMGNPSLKDDARRLRRLPVVEAVKWCMGAASPGPAPMQERWVGGY